MEIDDFIKKLENEFEQIAPGSLKPETDFQELTDWDSMHALILIALIDTEYDVTLSGEDLLGSTTVSLLFQTVKSYL
jgi:acyl carrier protein